MSWPPQSGSPRPEDQVVAATDGRSYLRPVGIVAGAAAAMAVESRTARPLAGGPLAFTAVELARRSPSGITRSVLPVGLLSEQLGHAETLARISDRRPPVAGLSFDEPVIVGVLNVTPDSFSDGGAFLDPKAALEHGQALIEAGAQIVDVGGESTRPAAEPVTPAEEQRRVLEVIEALAPIARARGAILSIDTRHASTMRLALDAGAKLINDVTALTGDPQGLAVTAESDAPVILMHMRGTPQTMQAGPRYEDAALDVYDHLDARIAACEDAGIPRTNIIVDPGIGFGKTVHHNTELIARAALFHGLGTPVMIGASRKSFIGRLHRDVGVAERLPGSLAAALAGLQQGVQLIRTHDVAASAQAISIWRSTRDSS